MKKTAILTACLSVLGLGVSAAAFGGDVTCSLETLHGTYAWGYAATNAGGPYSTSGRESYDGKGHMTWFQLFNSGGFSPATYSGTGTYTVSADCVANVVYNGFHNSVPYTYFLIPDGDGYFWNNNFGDGTVSGGRVDRISRALLVH